MDFPRKGADLTCIVLVALVPGAFYFSEAARSAYMALTSGHPFLAGFCKFAVLATFGEMLAQRLIRGQYLPEGFGLWPKAIVWGFLGVCITVAFIIFATGAPVMLEALGFSGAVKAMSGPLSPMKALAAFGISVTINTMFAPAMMVAHKIYDMQIAVHGAHLASLAKKLPVGEYLGKIDWSIMWSLVLYRSIVFFWIPAHTITFLLPPAFRVLFAAILGAVLGLILAWASQRDHKPAPEELM